MSEEENTVPIVEWTSDWRDIRQLIKEHQAKIMRYCMINPYESFLKNNDDEADTPIIIRSKCE